MLLRNREAVAAIGDETSVCQPGEGEGPLAGHNLGTQLPGPPGPTPGAWEVCGPPGGGGGAPPVAPRRPVAYRPRHVRAKNMQKTNRKRAYTFQKVFEKNSYLNN